jgi:hypothetical protein
VPSLMSRMRQRLPQWRRRSPDPFATLELQLRLGRLSSELDELARPSGTFALAHHATAAILAYDATLVEACRLIGAAVPEGRGPAQRLLMEATLANAGWSW